jgi:hypothetical protein
MSNPIATYVVHPSSVIAIKDDDDDDDDDKKLELGTAVFYLVVFANWLHSSLTWLH